MKWIALGLIVSACGTLYAQEPPAKIAIKAMPTEIQRQPVTEGEARKVFIRAEQIIRKVTKTNAPAPPINLGTTATKVKRAQVIAQLARLLKLTQPAFRLTPMPKPVDPAPLKIPSGVPRDQLTMLVRFGAVGNYSHLATGPGDTISVKDFGDALGFFMARIAQVTHMPSTEFTPFLEKG